MASLDLTYQVLATSEVEDMLFPATRDGNTCSQLRQLFHQIFLHGKQSYQGYFPILPGPPLHDVVAVAVLLENVDVDDGGGERWEVQMVLDGEQDGRTTVSACEKGKPGVRIPRRVGERAIWEAMKASLDIAEEQHP